MYARDYQQTKLKIPHMISFEEIWIIAYLFKYIIEFKIICIYTNIYTHIHTFFQSK